jgi:hypothetical protein
MSGMFIEGLFLDAGSKSHGYPGIPNVPMPINRFK